MKKIFLLLFTLLLISQVSALYLLEPVAKEITEELKIGAVMPNDTLTLVFSKEQYDTVSSNIPIQYTITEKNIQVQINFTQFSPNSLKRIELYFKDNENPTLTKTAVFLIPIQSNLIKIEKLNTSPLYAESEFGQPIKYYLKTENKSIAENTLIIKTQLPNRELTTKKITLKPLTTETHEIIISPVSPRYTNFTLTLENQNFTQDFKASYLSKPSLQSELSFLKAGFPISTTLLLPFYSLFSLFS